MYMDPDKAKKNKAKLGTFTNEKRWIGPGMKNPGVGEYDLTRFKNFAKASETVFEVPVPILL